MVHTAKLREDLDGDGASDDISLRCATTDGAAETSVQLRVGAAEAEVEVNISELIGCYLEAQALRPPGKQLWVTVDEHEEVGPDNVYLYAYAAGELELLWEGSDELDIDEAGTWETSASDCDASRGTLTTTTIVHRLSKKGVETAERKAVEKIDPSDCEVDDP